MGQAQRRNEVEDVVAAPQARKSGQEGTLNLQKDRPREETVEEAFSFVDEDPELQKLFLNAPLITLNDFDGDEFLQIFKENSPSNMKIFCQSLKG